MFVDVPRPSRDIVSYALTSWTTLPSTRPNEDRRLPTVYSVLPKDRVGYAMRVASSRLRDQLIFSCRPSGTRKSALCPGDLEQIL